MDILKEGASIQEWREKFGPEGEVAIAAGESGPDSLIGIFYQVTANTESNVRMLSSNDPYPEYSPFRPNSAWIDELGITPVGYAEFVQEAVEAWDLWTLEEDDSGMRTFLQGELDRLNEFGALMTEDKEIQLLGLDRYRFEQEKISFQSKMNILIGRIEGMEPVISNMQTLFNLGDEILRTRGLFDPNARDLVLRLLGEEQDRLQQEIDALYELNLYGQLICRAAMRGERIRMIEKVLGR